VIVRLACAALVVVIALLAVGIGSGAEAGNPTRDPLRALMVAPVQLRLETRPEKRDGRDRHAEPKVPSAAGIQAARAYAGDREGAVSFAVVNSEGELRGEGEDRRYPAASVVKSMLLAAETRQLKQAGEGMDSETDSLLTSMITISDNAAADSIYARVGDAGLNAAAERAGMTRFTVAGHWGNAQIAAGDMARFFADLDRQYPRQFREYAKGLLGSVTEPQRWGLPVVAGDRWAVRLKGGWLPDHALVHQAAELHERDGSRSLAVVVLTDDQPSFEYGVETVETVAARLLSRDGHP
jgi:hypothetical protein